MTKTRLAEQLLRSTILTGVAVSAAAPAFAQSDENTIVVTGSRIARQDIDAPSPITTVDSQQLLLSNTVNSESFLNSLPQVIPAFDKSSNNPGNGTATVQLRGLGTNRTLVLVDGLRFVGSGAGAPVDLNNIPSSLVESIDVVTGGTSAIYGSDAIAGVVNFKLRNDFEGIKLEASDQFTGRGDGNILNTTVTAGGNFADGRGNAVFSASYTNRQAVLQGERAFSSFVLQDPGAGNTASGFIRAGSSTIPGDRLRGRTSTNFSRSTAQVNAIDPACTNNSCSGFFINSAGQLRGLRFGTAADPQTDLYNFAPSNYLQLPQERYSIFGRASYEVSDNIEVYARGIFANSVVVSQLAPTPFGFTIAVNKNNPFITSNAALVNLFNGDAGSNPAGAVAGVPNSSASTYVIRFNKRGEELGPRISNRDTSTFQISGGVKVDLGKGWTWNTDAQFGRSSITQVQSGNVSIAAVRDAVLTTDGVTCTSGNVGCAALNLFGGPGSISPAAATYISRTGAQYDTVEQTQIVSALNGVVDSFHTPWAKSGLGLAIGVEYREEYANSLPDSVLGPDVLGFNQSLPVAGRFDVYEGFAEVQLPLIEDKPFFHHFGLNGAYRFSSYSLSNVGGTHSFAGGLDWEPVESVRFRAQFQRAVRAPNIGELFSARTNGFPGAQDPCSTGNGSFATGAPGLPATIAATCTATGVPAAAVGTSFQSNAQIEALFGGNPNLSQETANTYTYGVVWQPTFLDGLTIQADYYDIFVRDAIFTVSLQSILDSCHRLNVASACAVITRDPSTGEITTPFLPNLGGSNIGNLSTRGIDFQVDYSKDIGTWGSLGFKYNGNYTLENGFKTDPTTPFKECKGLYGGQCGEPTPKYKHTAQLSWLYDAFTTSLRWRYIGAEKSDVAGLSNLSDDIGAYNYLDATVQWNLNDHVEITAGVQNITKKDPPILGSQTAEQANTYPSTYEVLGRNIFIGASLKF